VLRDDRADAMVLVGRLLDALGCALEFAGEVVIEPTPQTSKPPAHVLAEARSVVEHLGRAAVWVLHAQHEIDLCEHDVSPIEHQVSQLRDVLANMHVSAQHVVDGLAENDHD